MNPLQLLLQDRNQKALAAKDLIAHAEREGRTLSPEESATFDRLTGEIDNLETRIKAMQEHNARSERMEKIITDINKPAGRQTTPDAPASGGANPAPPVGIGSYINAIRTRPLKAFKGANADHRAYRAGMWARAAIFGDQRAAQWCLTNGVGSDIRNALGGNQNTQGGFLVPEEFSQTIIDLREQYGVFRQNCFVQPMGRDTMVVPRRLTGLTIGPVGENPVAGITQSTPTWNQVRLTAKKAGGLALMSTEIAEDAVIDLADYLAEEFAYAFSLFEDQCGFIGDGSSTYLGINGLGNQMTTASSLAGVANAASGHPAFSNIDAVDLSKCMSLLPEYARMNAAWYCSSVALDLVFGRLMAAAGGNTIETIQGGYQRSYLGYPIKVSQVLPTSTGSLNGLPMLYFGDLSKAATLGDRRDVRVFPSEHRYMDTDQIGVRGTCRIDIVVHDVGSTTVAGPIVALCGTT